MGRLRSLCFGKICLFRSYHQPHALYLRKYRLSDYAQSEEDGSLAVNYVGSFKSPIVNVVAHHIGTRAPTSIFFRENKYHFFPGWENGYNLADERARGAFPTVGFVRSVLSALLLPKMAPIAEFLISQSKCLVWCCHPSL